jgi:hypothetical protein
LKKNRLGTMQNRFLMAILAQTIATALAAPMIAGTQASGAKNAGSAHMAIRKSDASPNAAANATDKKTWKLSYTADGQPDLQGIWTNLSFTPLVRPAKYGNREFLTKEEMDWDFKTGIARSYDSTLGNAADSPFYDATTYALDAWQNGIQPNPRTSLIVDPPNGQLPPLTPEAAEKRAARAAQPNAANAQTKADTAADVGLGVRCLTFGGPPILPSVSNSDLRIVQSAQSVLLEWEWDSRPRLIPLDGRPHLSPSIHRWNGDSRGHWEGHTLVVETTNFRPGAAYQDANPDHLKITEYFTRTNETTIEYKFTIDDPTTWTQPWSAVVPFRRIKGPMPEFACSEGNFSLVEILAAARAADKAAKEDASGVPDSPK